MKKTYCKPAMSRNERLTGVIPLAGAVVGGLALFTSVGAVAGAAAGLAAKSIATGVRHDFSRWERLPILTSVNATTSTLFTRKESV